MITCGLRRAVCEACRNEHSCHWDQNDDFKWHYDGIVSCSFGPDTGDDWLPIEEVPEHCPYAAEHAVMAADPEEPTPPSLVYELPKRVCQRCRDEDVDKGRLSRAKWGRIQDANYEKGKVWCWRADEQGLNNGFLCVDGDTPPIGCPQLFGILVCQRATLVDELPPEEPLFMFEDLLRHEAAEANL